MSDNSSEASKYNWPLIIAVIVGAGAIVSIAASILVTWVYNLNLLSWME